MGELVQGSAIGNVAWGKHFHAEAFSGITYPNGHMFEDIFTTHLIRKRVDKEAFLPDALFHYRIRKADIAHEVDLEPRVGAGRL